MLGEIAFARMGSEPACGPAPKFGHLFSQGAGPLIVAAAIDQDVGLGKHREIVAGIVDIERGEVVLSGS